jgi:hypothetical protein
MKHIFMAFFLKNCELKIAHTTTPLLILYITFNGNCILELIAFYCAFAVAFIIIWFFSVLVKFFVINIIQVIFNEFSVIITSNDSIFVF